jgi:8-oxo-dGTP diphosphatase
VSKSIEIIARGLLLKGGKVLACRSEIGGYFYLPGGHVEVGEAARDGLSRELMEEANLVGRIGRLMFAGETIFTAAGREHHELNLVFHVEHDAPNAVASREAGISFHWIDIASMIDVDFRPTAIKAWIASGFLEAGWTSDLPPKVR